MNFIRAIHTIAIDTVPLSVQISAISLGLSLTLARTFNGVVGHVIVQRVGGFADLVLHRHFDGQVEKAAHRVAVSVVHRHRAPRHAVRQFVL